MKWTLHPQRSDYTTTLPLTVVITSWEEKPKVKVEGLGELKLKRSDQVLKSEFYFTLPGVYQIEVSDGLTREVRELVVSEHQYLNFTNEFGFFSFLFLIVMGVVVLWTRKIMQK